MADYFRIPSNLFSLKQFDLFEDGKDDIILFWLRLYASAERRTKDGYPYLAIANIILGDKEINIIVGKKYEVNYVRETLEKLEQIGVLKRELRRITIIPPWRKKRDRGTDAYRKWRSSIFERDCYVCQKCGCNKNIQAHHIIKWSDTEENSPLRFDLNNGITLCKSCHLEEHGGNWRG